MSVAMVPNQATPGFWRRFHEGLTKNVITVTDLTRGEKGREILEKFFESVVSEDERVVYVTKNSRPGPAIVDSKFMDELLRTYEAVQAAEARLAYLAVKDRLRLPGNRSLADAIQECGLDAAAVLKLADEVEIE